MDNQNITYTGTVEVALDEMVKCVSEVTQANPKSVIQWIGTESDSLASPLSLTTSEKRRMHVFYIGLLKTLNN